MPSRPTLQKAAVSGFLFVSGAAALVYELAWSKYLGNVLGNSGQAHAVVLATFMGGLALGAFIFGRAADRSKSPMRLYGFLELGIGAYAVAFKPMLDALGRVYLSIAPALPEAMRLFAKLGLAGAALLPPTILMGGTLPPLVRHLTSQLSGVRRSLSRLYAVNSLGAASGAFVAGVFMVPSLGLQMSTRLAAAANVIIALSAIVLSRSAAPGSPEATEDDAQESVSYPLRAIRVALIGSALSGFSAMVCQITWIRLLALVLGASTYAFTLILTAFILGIGLGSYWLSRARAMDALKLFGLLQAGIAIAVCVALPLYVRMPLYLWRISDALAHSTETWSIYLGASFGLCCLVLLIPTALMGASFPAVARVATAKASELGRQLGGVYLWNTAGTILGSLLGGLVLMPAFTIEGAFAIAVAVNVIAALSAAWVARGTDRSGVVASSVPRVGSGSRDSGVDRRLPFLRRWWLPGVAASVAALIFFAGSTGWSELVANAGVFRDNRHPPENFAAYEALMKHTYTTELHRDDTFATVVVGEAHPQELRFLRINGKVDASDGDDMDTQILLGQLGPLLHSGTAKTALVVGLGSGVTVGSLASHPEFERIDVVEISPAVIEAARRFSYINGNALDDPRVHVHVDDARTFMLLQGLKYDVIVSEPSNPWVAGVAGLFTREFFQLAKDHLNHDGVLVQWMHLYEVEASLVQLVIRTVRDTFPYGTSWLGGLDMIMVSGAEPVTPDPSKLQARIDSPGVKADLARIHADGVASLLSLQVHSSEGQLAFAGPGTINTEDKNDLEYLAPIAFYLRLPAVSVHDERRGPDSSRLAISKYLGAHELTPGEAASMHAALLSAGSEDDPLVRAAAERWVHASPDDSRARRALGFTASAQKDVETAKAMLGPMIDAPNAAADPDLVAHWLETIAEEQHQRSAPWNLSSQKARELAAEALIRAPDHVRLREAASKLCWGEALEKCLPEFVRTAKSLECGSFASDQGHPPIDGYCSWKGSRTVSTVRRARGSFTRLNHPRSPK